MQHLTYRDLHPEDAAHLHEIVSCWEVVSMLDTWPWPARLDFTRGRAAPYPGNGFVWGICDNARVIGTVSVTEGELGYFLHPDFAGQGIMSRAVTQALASAFAEQDVDQIYAEIWADNPASRRIVEKHGFALRRSERMRSEARQDILENEHWILPRATWRALSDSR